MCDIIVIDMKSYDYVFNHHTQIETVNQSYNSKNFKYVVSKKISF